MPSLWGRRVLVGLLVGGVGLPPAVFASRCNQVTTVSDPSGGALTRSDLSDRLARICAVDFTANGANGIAVVFDSPDDTETNGQAVVKAEPGAATSGNSQAMWFGEEGRLTNFGLDVLVINGTAVIQWSGTP